MRTHYSRVSRRLNSPDRFIENHIFHIVLTGLRIEFLSILCISSGNHLLDIKTVYINHLFIPNFITDLDNLHSRNYTLIYNYTTIILL